MVFPDINVNELGEQVSPLALFLGTCSLLSVASGRGTIAGNVVYTPSGSGATTIKTIQSNSAVPEYITIKN